MTSAAGRLDPISLRPTPKILAEPHTNEEKLKMPSRPIGVTDTASGTGVADIDTLERGSSDLTTTTTADPGSGGTTLAVTSAAKFPATNNYKIRVEAQIYRKSTH